jgi:3D (Asp-Asp-Asp) domain-containing protein
MNGHGAFVVTSLLFVMITALVGFAAHGSAKLEASKYYVSRIETMHEERQQLVRQLAELNDIKIMEVTLTAYSPTVEECGPDPFTTASMTKVRPGIVAVSRDLYEQGWVFGKKVYVKGHGVFEIADLMSKRHTQRMDIFFPSTEDARQFGIKQTTVALLAG